MIECMVPKDILKYKVKFIGPFSFRETAFIALGALLCFLGYSATNAEMDMSMRMCIGGVCGLPMFLIGFMTFYDQPLEKIGPSFFMENIVNPVIRKKEIHYPTAEKADKTREWFDNTALYNSSPYKVLEDYYKETKLQEILKKEKEEQEYILGSKNDAPAEEAPLSKAELKKKKAEEKKKALQLSKQNRIRVQKSETYKPIR